MTSTGIRYSNELSSSTYVYEVCTPDFEPKRPLLHELLQRRRALKVNPNYDLKVSRPCRSA